MKTERAMLIYNPQTRNQGRLAEYRAHGILSSAAHSGAYAGFFNIPADLRFPYAFSAEDYEVIRSRGWDPETTGLAAVVMLADEHLPSSIIFEWYDLEDTYAITHPPPLDALISMMREGIEAEERRPKTKQEAVKYFKEQRQRYGGDPGPRQKTGYLRRQEREEQERQEQLAATVKIPWDSETEWRTQAEDGQHIWTYLIVDMEDAHLWNTVLWLVNNATQCYKLYTPAPQRRGNVSPSLVARSWLSQQKVFRALVREAVRRKLTFPPDVYNYIKEYVVGKTEMGEPQMTPPWKNPELADQHKELDKILDEEIEEKTGRPVRMIRPLHSKDDTS